MDQNQSVIQALKGDPTMVHQAPEPNPVPGIVDAFRAFGSGGLQGLANQQGVQTPEWSQKLGAKLSSPEANAALGTLYLSNPKYVGPSMFEHKIIDDNLNNVGTISYAKEPGSTNLHVLDVGPHIDKPIDELKNKLGTSEIRSLLRALKDEHPDVETVSGVRVSGARRGKAAVPFGSEEFEKAANPKIRIRPPFEERQKQEVDRLMSDPKFQEIVKKNMDIK